MAKFQLWRVLTDAAIYPPVGNFAPGAAHPNRERFYLMLHGDRLMVFGFEQ